MVSAALALESLPPGLRKFAADEAGCWLWSGTVNEKGYGRVRFGGRSGAPAHRSVWIALGGHIPDGLEMDHLEMDHLCRVRGCVNPAHLEPVTHAENNRRAAAAQTHCKQGHEFTEDNLISGPQRRCKACHRRQWHEYQARLRARRMEAGAA